MISPKNVAVKIYSTTGALVADFYNNVECNAGLTIRLNTTKNGGLDTFEFDIANNFEAPLFNGMICKFYVDGVHWDTGFADTIPEADSSRALVTVTGKGFHHKFKTINVNETYTSQTLDYIVKDIASSYLTDELQVIYNVANIATPTVAALTMEFKDKTLERVFESLLSICNADYANAQYRYFVDKDNELHFELISNDISDILFEGYHYQRPEVEIVSSKLVNKVLAYRTTAANSKEVEYVDTYSDVDSIANHGEVAKKITFPDYLIDSAVERMSDFYIEKYKEPLTKFTLEDVAVEEPSTFTFHRLINKRQVFFRTVAQFEDLTNWDRDGLSATTVSISNDEVFTNRTALKLVCAAGSQDEFMELTLDTPIYFPSFFRLFCYKVHADAHFIVRLIDTYGNTLDLPIGSNNEPVSEWLQYKVNITFETEGALLDTDYDVSNDGLMRVDVDASNYGSVQLYKLVRLSVINLSRIQIIMDNATASTAYFDEFSVQASAYKQRELILEEAMYTLNKASKAELVFGDQVDSLIDEITKKSKAGEAALEVFSKQ